MARMRERLLQCKHRVSYIKREVEQLREMVQYEPISLNSIQNCIGFCDWKLKKLEEHLIEVCALLDKEIDAL